MNRTEPTFRAGARPLIRGTFTDENGAAFTPTTTTLTLNPPDDSANIVHTDATISGNVAEKRLDPVNIVGRWHYRFAGDDGSKFAVEEDTFYVEPSGV